ncbi:hypothetical protein ANANG_G00108360 [Anguilla anguilla]|uniref:Uncharacterized protein n=1 Tax=Anguilla anguilla TaxID=7936 RepID=A0A9D3MHZ3_ANGAN|nr:hypothetical protein ANANG_G00108360 [Anguilla anguilla]
MCNLFGGSAEPRELLRFLETGGALRPFVPLSAPLSFSRGEKRFGSAPRCRVGTARSARRFVPLADTEWGGVTRSEQLTHAHRFENHCKEKRGKGLFHQITKTHGTVIGVSAGVVLVLFIISILVQMKQPRKKVVSRRPVFNKAGFQEVFDPPHYELFSLRDKDVSSDLAELSEELESYHKLRRSSTASRCVHEHHCGSQASSAKQSRTTLGSMELPYRNDFSQPPPMKTFNSTYKKSCYGYKQAHDCAEQVIEDRVMEEVPCEIYVRGGGGAHRNNSDAAQARSMSMDF